MSPHLAVIAQPLVPVFVMIVAYFRGIERLGLIHILSIILTFLGLLTIFSGGYMYDHNKSYLPLSIGEAFC